MNQILKEDYLLLVDIIKNKRYNPRELLRKWMRIKSTIKYLAEWESLHNQNLNLEGYKEYSKPLTKPELRGSGRVSIWIKYTNAIGFKKTRGKYGKIWVYKEIALSFTNWLNSENINS